MAGQMYNRPAGRGPQGSPFRGQGQGAAPFGGQGRQASPFGAQNQSYGGQQYGGQPYGGQQYGGQQYGGYAPAGGRARGKSHAPVIIIAAAALVIIGAIIFWVSSYSKFTPSGTVRTYLSAMKQGNAEKMLDCYEPEVVSSYEKLLGKDALKLAGSSGLFSNISQYTNFDPEIVSSEKSGNQATVKVRLNAKGSGSIMSGQEIIFHLKKVNAKWYIKSI